MVDSEKILGSFAISSSILFGVLSCYIIFGRTLHLQKGQVRAYHTTFRKFIVPSVAVLNAIYAIVYVDGYKYIKSDVLDLVKPAEYHLLVYVLINMISIGLFGIAFFSSLKYCLFVYLPYVIQWTGFILILANEIMFRLNPANIACAVLLILIISPLIFIIPRGLIAEKVNIKINASQLHDPEETISLKEVN